MNALESSIYSFRDALSTSLSNFLSESDKEKLGAMLTSTEDWLYDDGKHLRSFFAARTVFLWQSRLIANPAPRVLPSAAFDAEKSVYQAKLKEVQDAFAPASSRAREAENRPDALAELQKQISRFTAFATDTSEEYAHIKAEDKEKVAAESQKAEEWLAGMSAKLADLAMTDEPPVKVSEVVAKTTALIGACRVCQTSKCSVRACSLVSLTFCSLIRRFDLVRLQTRVNPL